MNDDSAWEQHFVPTSLAHFIMAGEGGVLLDLGRDEFLGLNPLAQDIWMHLIAGYPRGIRRSTALGIPQLSHHLLGGAPSGRVLAR
ncbi:MAG: hypothetical protein ABI456_09150, partial [Ktedonobacteraceae bacterium]